MTDLPAGLGPERKEPRPAVFIDRDGTLNHDSGYLYKFEDFRWIEGVPEALSRLKAAGLALAVVTNQSGVARGIYSLADVRLIHERIDQDLRARQGMALDGWYFCPHHPDRGQCQCRKPAPGLLLAAAADLGLDIARSYMVGDKSLDVQAGLAAGVRLAILVLTGYGPQARKNLPEGTMVADSFPQAAELILSDFSAGQP
ncbi:MAG: D-glycero-beta-D-manno-heptose 1,7-bisphosphate 7-phosphatase [Deltaproteobacteria bacterium]|jgi:D-glycero-D-manno-heptose 1,7-bisphosphate phosphatase|nr:D-glycero-beta-D-manno-heptose 1,7-bisphosphate 7-phosphatase [Deltaproteobacteria bacterium]